MALKITLFSDFICPFCYIGFHTLQKMQREFDLEVAWRGFQIHPDWPATGISADKVYGAQGSDSRKAAWERISTMATEIGLAMRPPTVLTNSYNALAACEYAIASGKGEEFEERVYRAYFHDGSNIGDVDVLKNLASEVGLEAEKVAEATTAPAVQLKLKNNALVAHQHGVSGVPTFFIGNYPLVGAQSELTMRKILTRATEMLSAAK
ncbi:MAG TPA: DsbA family oxidoreductase [Candidatus Binataceae bacterium]|nr:DsbA family oxidoreductase [Candidatus Binataceae bacterium]